MIALAFTDAAGTLPIWKIATFTFLGLAMLSPIVLEITRAIVHHAREQRGGGTQDIAMWGSLIMIALILCCGVCGRMWYLDL